MRLAADRGPDGRRRERGPGRVTAETAARLAAGYVAEMTDREPEAIVALDRADDAGWEVDVEVVETRRIPDSTDVIAVYRTRLNAEGDLMSCRRVQRRTRCQTGRDDA